MRSSSRNTLRVCQHFKECRIERNTDRPRRCQSRCAQQHRLRRLPRVRRGRMHEILQPK